jgi:galactokinase
MVFSPGRINLIGEHTDYNDGFVFPAAIDLGIVLAINKSSSKTSRVYALNKKESYEIDLNQISPQKNGGWRNYVIGVIGDRITAKLSMSFEKINGSKNFLRLSKNRILN